MVASVFHFRYLGQDCVRCRVVMPELIVILVPLAFGWFTYVIVNRNQRKAEQMRKKFRDLDEIRQNKEWEEWLRQHGRGEGLDG